MLGFIQFCWRAIQNNTVAAVGGVAMTVAGVNWQEWLASLAGSPPPILTNHFVQLAIIAVGFLLLAYVLYRQTEAERASQPKPDMDVKDVFRYLRERSRWSIGKPFEREVNGENRLIDEEIDGILRSAAAQKRIHIWGKEDTRSWLGNETEILLLPETWIDHRFDLIACLNLGSTDARTWSTNRSNDVVFKELRANKAEIQKEWPPASYLRRKLDRALAGRTL